MSPSPRREAVCMLQERFELSERRACRITGQHRPTQRRLPTRGRGDDALRTEPYYRADAPESGGGPLRSVVVFRLMPVGDVLRDPQDRLRIPIRRTPPSSGGPEVEDVEIEQRNTEHYQIAREAEPRTAERRESELVARYVAHLRAAGRRVTRKRIIPTGEGRPLYSDVFEHDRVNLIEAKGTVTREAARMAIGQLADYARFIAGANRAVLLPEEPRPDLIALLESQRIAFIWPVRDGFSDSASGSFV